MSIEPNAQEADTVYIKQKNTKEKSKSNHEEQRKDKLAPPCGNARNIQNHWGEQLK